ncbi:MAG: hypothetical protein GF368_01905 [Candidatus Aenigmarchaeota archaeon]|nr:hypothetical protein [Candidatus Aenigmarchaeota archaeon]
MKKYQNYSLNNYKITIGIPIEETKLFCFEDLLNKLLELEKPDSCKILFVANQRNEFYDEIDAISKRKKYRKLRSITRIASLDSDTNDTVWNSGNFVNIVRARNTCIDEALENNSDFLFFLDADVFPSSDVLVRLTKLVVEKPNKSIFGGYYNSRFFNNYPMIGNFKSGGSIGLIFEGRDFESGDIITCDAAGMGCVLLPSKLIEELKFDEEVSQSEDIDYFRSAKNLGYNLCIDTSVKCEHKSIFRERLNKKGKEILILLGEKIYEFFGPYFMRDELLSGEEFRGILNQKPKRNVIFVENLPVNLLLEDSGGNLFMLATEKKKIGEKTPCYIIRPKKPFNYDSEVHNDIKKHVLENLELGEVDFFVDSFVTVVD